MMLSMRAHVRRALMGLLVGGAFWLPATAFAVTTFTFGDYLGTNVDYIDVNETTNTDTVEFEAPTLNGDDSLTFFPTDFTAEATGAGGFATTQSLLNATIMSKNGTTLDIFRFTETGDSLILGSGQNFIQLSGSLILLEDVDGPITPTSINFSVADGNVVFDPSDFITTPGASTWSGMLEIDLMGLGITKAELQLDNNLFANSFAEGSISRVQKKFGGISLEIIPEPGTGLLVGLGLLGLGLRQRRTA